MGHPKFVITNKEDRNNFLKYLKNNEKKVLEDLTSLLSENCNDDFSVVTSGKEDFLSHWNKILKASYIRDTEQGKIWEDATTLLYMLPAKRVNAIKVSLRAMRRRASASNKKTQLTIDADVYEVLSSFAKSKGLTLSDAINELLSPNGASIVS